QRAVGAGAEARFGTAVSGWEPTRGGGVRVTTAAGETVEAAHLVIAAGAWFAQVAPELALPLQIERNVMHYFGARDRAAQAELDGLPVYVVERDEGRIYGFPSLPGAGLKIAFYRSHHFVSLETVDRTVDPREELPIRAFLADLIPSAAGPLLQSRVCLYTLTPDEHFIIGMHPQYSNVVLAGGFSGHGFKFCSAVGEIIAQLALDGETPHAIGLFSPQRFAAPQASNQTPVT
ncbi:MAG: FAD-dependent oxidoreductase, partial [Vulcanimicrobiaceae bacterium]